MAVSKRLRFEVFRRDAFRCRYCGRTATETELQVDHVVPETLGGNDDPANLVTACNTCNAGKSSAPLDGPVVAQVAADALRWANAMRQAAETRLAQRDQAQSVRDAFLAEWNSWTYQYRGEKKTIPIPANWPTTIDQFIAAGLDMVDLKELLDVAMSARCKDEWRYFCGCCWTRIRQLQEHAAEIVKVVPADPPPALLSTSWTREQVDHRIDSAVRAMQADDWSPGFTKADLGKGCGHGVGCEDDLCQLTSAAALAMYIRVTDRDEAAQLFEESALLDVADVDDDEFLELVA